MRPNHSPDAARYTDTIDETAARHKVSRRTVRDWIAAGEIAAVRFGPRLIRIDPTSLPMTPLGPGRDA